MSVKGVLRNPGFFANLSGVAAIGTTAALGTGIVGVLVGDAELAIVGVGCGVVGTAMGWAFGRCADTLERWQQPGVEPLRLSSGRRGIEGS